MMRVGSRGPFLLERAARGLVAVLLFLVPGGQSANLFGDPGTTDGAGAPALSVVYVDARAPGRGDGSGWEHAFTSLQAALAAHPGAAEIRVAQGTYRPGAPGERGRSFFIGRDIFLQGGYLGYGSPEPDARAGSTVLSGDLNGDDQPGFINIADNSFHVVVITDTSVLDRLEIGGGNADAHYTVDDPDRAWKGAGVFCEGGEPLIQECLIFSNIAGDGEKGWGGGLYVGSCIRLVNCTFKGNAAVVGGGILGPPQELIGCTFEGNHASLHGGGFYVGGRTAIEGCRFLGNSAGWDGGGIYNLDTGQGPTLVNCLFASNTAERRGGGMLNDETAPRILNSTFHGNSALEGGGMWNTATGGFGDEIPMSLTNCILWGNADGDGSGETAQAHGGPAGIAYCCVQGWTGALGGAGNIGSDPLFADPDSLDFSLRAGSPAIDTATSEGAPMTDIEGHGRPCGNGVDMGAHEFGDCPGPQPFIRGNTNGDGASDISDAVTAIGFLFLGSPMNDCLDAADANDDGVVDISDPVWLLVYLFLGAEPPPEPFLACGMDSTVDGLDCKTFNECP
jgi:hypothetical protein